jgi:TolB-like protein/Tfp pilus assembly protein PilF
MKGTPPVPSSGPPDHSSETRFQSWKEIATYVKRDVSTVQRWEKRECMPIHRHMHDKRGSVYALRSELDSWLANRAPHLEAEEKEARTVLDLEEGQDRHKSRLRLWFAVGALMVLTVFAVTNVNMRIKTAAPAKIRSLAVLPLKNLSGDPNQEYLADGMTEALIGRLSRIGGLRVTSRTSVMAFQDARIPAPEIAKKLDVDAIVEGSVIREGDRIRIHAQMIHGTTDEHLWSEAYDRDVRDALALQSDVAQAIARKVEVTVTGKEQERLTARRSVSPQVYESYLKGQFALNNFMGRATLEESRAYFEDAISKDPTFAPAYLGLANAYNGLSTIFVGGARPDEARAKVISAARKALELDPELADAHVFLASAERKQWHWAEAESEYKLALELEPSNPSAQAGFGFWLLCQGRLEEALAWTQRARERDPLAVSGVDVAWILFHARRYDEAIRELRAVLAVQPEDPDALWILGFALIANGQSERAIPVLEKAAEVMKGSPGTIELLAAAHARAGNRAQALRLINDLKRRQKTEYVPPGAFINPYLALGEYDQAFLWFERAYQEHSNILQFLKVHPFFDPVRGDTRFADLLRRVGLGK